MLLFCPFPQGERQSMKQGTRVFRIDFSLIITVTFQYLNYRKLSILLAKLGAIA